jgi:hypothetical protein
MYCCMKSNSFNSIHGWYWIYDHINFSFRWKLLFVIFYFISFVSKQQANTPMFFCLIHAKGYSVWLIRCLNSVIITLYQSMVVSCCFIFIFNSFAVICILVLFCIMRLCFLSTIQLIILPYALCIISPSVFLII